MPKLPKRDEAPKTLQDDPTWRKVQSCPIHRQPLYNHFVELIKTDGVSERIAVVPACPGADTLGNEWHLCGELVIFPNAPKAFTAELWAKMAQERVEYRKRYCVQEHDGSVTTITEHTGKHKEYAPKIPQAKSFSKAKYERKAEPEPEPKSEPEISMKRGEFLKPEVEEHWKQKADGYQPEMPEIQQETPLGEQLDSGEDIDGGIF